MARALLLLAAAARVAAHGGGGEETADNVLALTPETFKSHVGGALPAFVMFYAPWYVVSRRLAKQTSGRVGGLPISSSRALLLRVAPWKRAGAGIARP